MPSYLYIIIIMTLSNSIHSSKLLTSILPTKLIYFSPGGFNGFYMLGIAAFLRDNYDMTKYNFYGASAGSWLSLFMSYKYNHHDFINKIGILDYSVGKANIKKLMEFNIKQKILQYYSKEDFHLERISIAVTQFNSSEKKFKLYVYNQFNELDDTIDCCIASSHIPFITGDCLKKYNNKITFDGGFSKIMNEQLNPVLQVTPSIWSKKPKKKGVFDFFDVNSLFPDKNYNVKNSYNKGYQDSEKNKHVLDDIFLEKPNL